MFCPDCGAEYRDGIDRCRDCEVPLVAEPPAEPSHDEADVVKYVTILATSEVSVIPVLKTVLESAEIPYRTRGEGLMNLFPSEALGAPLHGSAGEVRILVPEALAEQARELLSTSATVDEDAEADASS